MFPRASLYVALVVPGHQQDGRMAAHDGSIVVLVCRQLAGTAGSVPVRLAVHAVHL